MTPRGDDRSEHHSGYPSASTAASGDIDSSGRKNAEILVDDSHLSPVTTRPTLFEYTRVLWKRRHFISVDAQSKALSSGRDTYLGNLWLLLDPIFQVCIYAIVFGAILNVSRGMDNFLGFLAIGVIFFGFIQKSVISGSGLIQASRNLITSFNFPVAAVAISSILRNALDNILPAIAAVVAALLFQYDKPPSWTIFLVLPLFLLMHVFSLGACLIIARATAFIPDLKSIVAVLTRGLFFISGVFFSISRFDTHPVLRSIVEANPIYQFLMAVRSCVIDGAVPPLNVWMYLSAWSFILLIVGYIYFWQREERYSSVR